MASVTAISKEALDLAVEAEGILFSGQTVISFEGEPSFDEATQRWNSYKAPSFSASITVNTEQDVAGAVKLARALQVGFLATSSRHGYGMTLNRLQGGLAIDLSQMNGIEVTGSTITVGPGATTEKIIAAVDKAGYEIPVGSHDTLSLVGVAIGGGVNRWSGVYGLVLDSLVSARVVLHDGRLVEASESQNPDLFWAIRGAGANFGIVVSATFKMQEAINHGNLFSADIIIPISQAEKFFDVIKSLHDNFPAQLGAIFYIVWNEDLGQPIIMTSWVWHGTEEESQAAVAPFLALETIAVNKRTIRWKDVIAGDAGLRVANLNRMIYGVNLREVDVATFKSTVDKFGQLYQDFPAARGSAFVAEFLANNATMEVDDEATAYPWRDATANLMIQMSWVGSDSATEAAAKAVGEQVRQDHAKTGGYPGLSVYVNYAVGDEPLEDVYGKHKLPRLLQLKALWDPENVFRYHHPLLRE